MRGNPYLSRLAGSKGPYAHHIRQRVVVKPVYIGNHAPTDHYAQAAKKFIPAEELYVPKRRQR
jgi:hypothetical protein